MLFRPRSNKVVLGHSTALKLVDADVVLIHKMIDEKRGNILITPETCPPRHATPSDVIEYSAARRVPYSFASINARMLIAPRGIGFAAGGWTTHDVIQHLRSDREIRIKLSASIKTRMSVSDVTSRGVCEKGTSRGLK